MECSRAKNPKDESSEVANKLSSQKTYYKETFRFIDEALKLEDKEKKAEALLCYERSLRSISNGCAISLNRSEATEVEYKQYEIVVEKLNRARSQVCQRMQALGQPSLEESGTADEGIEMGTEEVESMDTMDQKDAIPAQPSAPPSLQSSSFDADHGDSTWHDTRELVTIEQGVRLFHVKGTDVSTWTSHCALQVFQILKEKLPGELSPPAFLKCGDWLFPMEPGKSPVLKSAHRTYMFPDISTNQSEVNDLSSIPCVGIVLADLIPDELVTRFERILSLYSDFRKDSTTMSQKKEKPERPPPPKLKSKNDETGESSSGAVARTEIETVVAEQGLAPSQSGDLLSQYDSKWSQAITKGIQIGSQWISWGFVKGSDYASTLVEKGSNSLQKRLRPESEAAQVSPEVARNIRQLHQTTGSVVQISAFLASTLGALVTNLGKNLAPLVLHQGAKFLPDKYKVENNEKTQKVLDDAKKVAVAGLQGFSLVFLALEQSGKNLYQSVTRATVQTVQHKYGENAAVCTGDAMGAAGNTAQAIWNVRKLGPKAIAKNTAKETGKAILDFESQENPHSNGNNKGGML